MKTKNQENLRPDEERSKLVLFFCKSDIINLDRVSSSGKSTSILLGKRRNTAESKSYGRFVAPITNKRSLSEVRIPSIWIRNSVFSRLDTFKNYQKLKKNMWSKSEQEMLHYKKYIHLSFLFSTLTKNRINFINKYDRRLTVTSNLKQSTNNFFCFTNPFWC